MSSVAPTAGPPAGAGGVPDAPRGAPGRSRSRLGRPQAINGLLLVTPFLVVLVVFLLVPLAYALRLSLYTYTIIGGDTFSGLQNYLDAFADTEFTDGVRRVFLFGLVQTPVMILVALVGALLVDAVTSRFAKAFRLMMFAPYAVPAVIGALMWGFLYSPESGPLTTFTSLLGLGEVDFIGAHTVLFSVGNVLTWEFAGYNMIVLYSALQGISHEIYEAAVVDGASPLQIALRIKTPLIGSSIVMVTVFTIIGTLQLFVEPFLLQPLDNGVITNSFTPNMYGYMQAFSYQQYNYSAALSFLLGAVVFVGSYLFLFLTRRRSAL